MVCWDGWRARQHSPRLDAARGSRVGAQDDEARAARHPLRVIRRDCDALGDMLQDLWALFPTVECACVSADACASGVRAR